MNSLSPLTASDDQLALGSRPVTPQVFDFNAAHTQPRTIYLRDELRRLSALCATAERDARSDLFSGVLGDTANGLADLASELDAVIERDAEQEASRYSSFNLQGPR